jgi:hypothetical protein
MTAWGQTLARKGRHQYWFRDYDDGYYMLDFVSEHWYIRPFRNKFYICEDKEPYAKGFKWEKLSGPYETLEAAQVAWVLMDRRK